MPIKLLRHASTLMLPDHGQELVAEHNHGAEQSIEARVRLSEDSTDWNISLKKSIDEALVNPRDDNPVGRAKLGDGLVESLGGTCSAKEPRVSARESVAVIDILSVAADRDTMQLSVGSRGKVLSSDWVEGCHLASDGVESSENLVRPWGEDVGVHVVVGTEESIAVEAVAAAVEAGDKDVAVGVPEPSGINGGLGGLLSIPGGSTCRCMLECLKEEECL